MMTEYSYIAQTPAGAIKKGRMHGENPDAVHRIFKHQGCRLLSIDAVADRHARRTGQPTSGGSSNVTAVRFIRSPDIELWMLQLSVMLESGLELAPALSELRSHSPKAKVRMLSDQMLVAIEQGDRFSDALAKSKCFPDIVVPLVQIGESSGDLAAALRRASDFVEHRRRARGKVVSTLAYPVVIATAAFSVAFYMVGWAIPQLGKFLDSMGRKLPAMTQSLLDVAGFLRSSGPLLGVLVVTGLIALVLCYFWPPGRYRIDQFVLRIPLLGKLLQFSETQQLAGSLALLLRSGVFLQDALETAAMLNRNQHLAAEVVRSRHKVAQGKSLAASLRDRGFGALLASMVAVGEQTGELPKALDHVSLYYGGQVETQLNRISKLIEPTIIVLVGGLVGYVYLAFLMALMSAGGKF